VKGAFRYGKNEDELEHMWCIALSIDVTKITARLGNKPRYRKDLKEGSVVTFTTEELTDWGYPVGDDFAGMFVEKILRGG